MIFFQGFIAGILAVIMVLWLANSIAEKNTIDNNQSLTTIVSNITHYCAILGIFSINLGNYNIDWKEILDISNHLVRWSIRLKYKAEYEVNKSGSIK